MLIYIGCFPGVPAEPGSRGNARSRRTGRVGQGGLSAPQLWGRCCAGRVGCGAGAPGRSRRWGGVEALDGARRVAVLLMVALPVVVLRGSVLGIGQPCGRHTRFIGKDDDHQHRHDGSTRGGTTERDAPRPAASPPERCARTALTRHETRAACHAAWPGRWSRPHGLREPCRTGGSAGLAAGRVGGWADGRAFTVEPAGQPAGQPASQPVASRRPRCVLPTGMRVVSLGRGGRVAWRVGCVTRIGGVAGWRSGLCASARVGWLGSFGRAWRVCPDGRRRVLGRGGVVVGSCGTGVSPRGLLGVSRERPQDWAGLLRKAYLGLGFRVLRGLRCLG